ncbi:restriction endonuclease [Photobacterium kishitanii]|uniref:restriction endonuclease n=1 Tax=Photobacterium kishitanii TaxID=318456 RepID=UPI00071AEFDF|nr:restriction endonuclease [Photobacterium kishitanii]
MTLWERIKLLKSWAISNFWNLFSFIGVVATLYLGFFYVPDYVEELGLNKQKLAHQELVADVQELLFYKQPITLTDVDEIIKGKELVYAIKYNFTSPELLNQIQDDFLQNKFIPLEQRKELMVAIKKLRSQYKEPSVPTATERDYSSWRSLFIYVLTGVISTLGLSSIFVKLKSDKETEVDISSSISNINISGDVVHNSNTYQSGYEFEAMVRQVIDDLDIEKSAQVSKSDQHFDFLINVSGTECIVDVKAYSKLLGLGTAKEFVNVVNNANKIGILVAKSGLTKRATDLINGHNELAESNRIYVVTGSTRNDVKKSMQTVINSF